MWQYSCQLRGFHVSSEPFAECSKLRAGSSGWFSCTNDLVTLTLRQFQQIHRIPWTAALPCRLGYEFSLSFFHAETLQRQKLMQHALGVDGSYAWFAKTWANCTWWQCFPKLKASTQGGYIHRSKKDIHTACFRCKGQPWRVCMHNRNWETRALWQFIVSADDYFKALAISVSQAASQVWYTKADSYAPCFWTSDQSSGWFASTNVILLRQSPKSPGQLMCPAG